jgi:hypothetical protein
MGKRGRGDETDIGNTGSTVSNRGSCGLQRNTDGNGTHSHRDSDGGTQADTRADPVGARQRTE